MKLSEPYSGNASFDGELSIAGVKASSLAKEFGTPLFVIDEADFYARALAWRDALNKHFGEEAGTVYYAGKAFLNKEVARWIKSIGIGLDACSGGELAVASSVDFPVEQIELHGNNKSEAEIERMVREAESHAEDDKKKKELIEARNDADSLCYSTEKSLEEHKDKLEANDVEEIRKQITELRKSSESDNVEEIKAKLAELQKGAMKIGDAMYKQNNATNESNEDKKDDEKVMDADFKEKK